MDNKTKNLTPKTPLSSRRRDNSTMGAVINNNTNIGGSLMLDNSPLVEDQCCEPVIGKALQRLGQRVAQSQFSMDKLRELAEVWPSELITGFALNKRSSTECNAKFEEECNKIRSATNVEQARKLAESHLIGFCDISRKFEAQRRRMDTLESRTTRMETIFDEQICLNKQLGDEAVQALSRFEDVEKKRVEAMEEANTLLEATYNEMSKLKGRSALLEDSNRELRAQLEEFTKEKCEMSRKLLDCQNECHSLRLANDQMQYDEEMQKRMLEGKEALIGELRERERRNNSVLAESERCASRMESERDEANNRLAEERNRSKREADEWRRESERKMNEEKATLADELRTQHKTELENVQTEQKALTELLKKAAETHRKLEKERNELYKEKGQLEDNLNAYKRRFVAELNREMSGKYTQLGSGLNTALMDVMDRIDFDGANPKTNESGKLEKAQQQRRPSIDIVLGDEDDDDPAQRRPSTGSSISVFECCENAPRAKQTAERNKTAMAETKKANSGGGTARASSTSNKQKQRMTEGKENGNNRQQQKMELKKRPTTATIPGFFHPPPPLAIAAATAGSKRKSTTLMAPPKVGWPPKADGRSGAVSSPDAGRPTTSTNNKRQQNFSSKFPNFQL